MYSLRGKVVLITGGSRGLGLVLARTFARAGARVVVTARDEAELQRAHDDLIARGGKVLAVPCDVTDRGQVEHVVRTAVDWFGRLDVLVNNAGIMNVGPLDLMTDEDFQRAMATHFWGPLWATRAAVAEMKKGGGGRVVNVSSIGGLVGVPHMAPYVASKFALSGLGESFRTELAKDRIVVTNVYPGLMRTGSTRQAYFKGRQEAEHAWFSVGGALPLLTMSAPRAARRIVLACIRGEAHVVLGLPAKLLALAHALAPGLVLRVQQFMNRLLPGARGGPVSKEWRRGVDMPARVSPTVTFLSDRAAARNNELRV